MYAHPFVLLNSWTLRYDCPFARLKCVFLDTLMTKLPRGVFLPLSTPQPALSPDYPTLLSSYLDSWFLSTLTLPHKRDLKQNKIVRVSFLKPWVLGEAAGCGTVFALRSKSLPHFFLVFPVLSNPVTRCCLTWSPPCYWIVSDFHLLFSPGYWSSTCCFPLGYSSSKLNDSTAD